MSSCESCAEFYGEGQCDIPENILIIIKHTVYHRLLSQKYSSLNKLYIDLYACMSQHQFRRSSPSSISTWRQRLGASLVGNTRLLQSDCSPQLGRLSCIYYFHLSNQLQRQNIDLCLVWTNEQIFTLITSGEMNRREIF